MLKTPQVSILSHDFNRLKISMTLEMQPKMKLKLDAYFNERKIYFENIRHNTDLIKERPFKWPSI